MFIPGDAANIHVVESWDRPSSAAAARLRDFPVALIADAKQRMDVIDGAIQRRSGEGPMAGAILPVLAREGDNLAIHRATDVAQPGDILVIDAGGYTRRAVFGALLGRICAAAGIAGVVIDGATRDLDELNDIGLSVYARGVSPLGPWKDGPGRVGVPVACGGIVCNPGDLIIGDSDGLVIVQAYESEQLAIDVRAQLQREEAVIARIEASVLHG